MSYVPLWCKSNFSFLEGASHPWELVEKAHALGLPAVAITDRDGVYGVVRAYVKAKELGIKLIVGAEVSLAIGKHACRVVLLARHRQGWRHLCRLLTKGHRRSDKKGTALYMTDIADSCASVALAPGDDTSDVGWIAIIADSDSPMLTEAATALHDMLGTRVYMGISRHWREGDVAAEARQRMVAGQVGIACVALPEVLYHEQARRPLQDAMTCIRHGVTFAQSSAVIRANDEHHLQDAAAFAKQWVDDPAAVARTLEIAEACTFSLGEIRYRYPTEVLPSGISSLDWLRELTCRGAHWRYGGVVPAAVWKQLERELGIISQLDYAGYFLTMYEIVQFCQKSSILCQGRGSAANSVVCYTLGVTAVEPVNNKLLFERFLSLERAEPPDIDLDIEHVRREEVIMYMYERYGRDRAAMVCNIIRYRGRSAWRDLGKVFGLGKEALVRGAKQISCWKGLAVTDELTRKLGALTPYVGQQMLALCAQLMGMPRHISIHPGGFLLGHEPVCDLVPIENATMTERTVIQWDKDDIETLGLFKVDLLALGALTQLRYCFALLKETRGVEFTLATVPGDDPATYNLMCRADTLGVFQIESRAQMSMLPRLRPQTFYDLVIEISLVRPGPISGDMVHPYLRRRQGKEPIEYPHDVLIPVLERTLGVPLFQEQVMQLAVVAADYTPGQADQLRRDMAAWKQHGRIDEHRDRLMKGMMAKGISAAFAERVFNQIKGFGEYGFPESHASSFAIIAYATSYLRANYLPEFVCSLLNAQPMGFYSPATIVLDTKRHGVDVLPIDVNHSKVDCTIETANGAFAVRLGLRWVRGLGQAAATRIVSVREAGRYPAVHTLMQRAQISVSEGKALAEAGAFASMADVARRDAVWQVRGWDKQQHDAIVFAAPDDPHFAALSRQDELLWDFAATGMSPTNHPLAPCRPRLAAQGLLSAAQVVKRPHDARVRYLGQVICRQHPQTANGVTFMTLEDETGFVNLVIWKPVFDRYEAIVNAAALIEVHGVLQVQEGVVHLIAEQLYLPGLLQSPQGLFTSRDFH